MEAYEKTVHAFDDVFDALAETATEAANMKARADLLSGIRARVATWNLAQDEAAKQLGISRPRLNDLLRCKIDKFSLDALVNIATAAGLTLHIELVAAA